MAKYRELDERGAIMLIAVFFAIFAVAMLYYTVGIAGAVVFREKLQDASDAAALSAAVMHARAMNFIVLINIIMASLLAILVTMKLVQAVATFGAILALALSAITFGATAAAAPPLEALANVMEQTYDATRGSVFAALELLHNLSDVVASSAPLVADAASVAQILADADLPNTKGIAFSTETRLPVADESYKTLCKKAAQIPGGIATGFLGAMGLPDAIGSELNGVVGSMAAEYSDWFCGDGDKKAPSRDYVRDGEFPQTELNGDCKESVSELGDDRDFAKARTDECDKADRDKEEARPDDTTGGCQTGHDCKLGGPYDEHVALARVQCIPTQDPQPTSYIYQTRIAEGEFRWNGTTWEKGRVSYHDEKRVESDSPPCGVPKLISESSMSTNYNTVVHRNDDVNDVEPVCFDDSELVQQLRQFPEVGKLVHARVKEVSQILGCKRPVTIHVTAKGGKPDEPSNEKAPKKVDDDAKLTGEKFQIRAIVHADFRQSAVENIVRLSLWGHPGPDNGSGVLSDLGKFSIAQAEYYYNGKDPRSEWMWNMNWRGRLRRFHLPVEVTKTIESQVCPALGDTCDTLIRRLPKLEDLMSH